MATVAALQQMETGVQMWSFSGKLLYRLPRDRFTQVPTTDTMMTRTLAHLPLSH